MQTRKRLCSALCALKSHVNCLYFIDLLSLDRHCSGRLTPFFLLLRTNKFKNPNQLRCAAEQCIIGNTKSHVNEVGGEMQSSHKPAERTKRPAASTSIIRPKHKFYDWKIISSREYFHGIANNERLACNPTSQVRIVRAGKKC